MRFFLIINKPKKSRRKCGMYYSTYIPWCFKNNKLENLDQEDIDWFNDVYSKEKKIDY